MEIQYLRIIILLLLIAGTLLSPIFTQALTYSSTNISSLKYFVVVYINSFINEEYNGSITLNILNYTNNTVYFNVIGIGNIYKLSINLTELLLMDAYNGSYKANISLGSGFPQLSEKQLYELRSGDFTINGSNVVIQNTTLNLGSNVFKAYEIEASKSTSIGTGSLYIWVNESNGIILMIKEEASSALGTVVVYSTLTQFTYKSSPNNTSTISINTSLLDSSIYSHLPSNPVYKLEFIGIIASLLTVIVVVIILILRKLKR
ncbi:hypothetical protein WIW90_07530 [Sulfolobaceae archaeon RB850M]|jgi:hypothetical protein